MTLRWNAVISSHDGTSQSQPLPIAIGPLQPQPSYGTVFAVQLQQHQLLKIQYQRTVVHRHIAKPGPEPRLAIPAQDTRTRAQPARQGEQCRKGKDA